MLKMRSYSLLFMFVLACGGDSGSSSNKGTSNNHDAATGERDSGSASQSNRDAGVLDQTGDDASTDQTGGSTSGNDMTGGNMTGSGDMPVNDSGIGTPLSDGGVVMGTGSCCEAHDTPGCEDANLEVCVCELDSTCCTQAWGIQCTYIVEQKYCQPGVRDCVCGTGTGQWGRTECCGSDWNSTCDAVATGKCNAVQGCF